MINFFYICQASQLQKQNQHEPKLEHTSRFQTPKAHRTDLDQVLSISFAIILISLYFYIGESQFLTHRKLHLRFFILKFEDNNFLFSNSSYNMIA
jgi:hypothetical protein